MFRILIAEDEHLVMSGIKSILEWKVEGIEIVGEAEDGEEALELFYRYVPDLLITDIRMPKLSGLELVEKAREFSTQTHVLVISGYDEFEYAQQALRLGAVDYLLKPIEADYLAESVRTLMRNKQNNSMLQQKQSEWYIGCQAVVEEVATMIWEGNLESIDGVIDETIAKWFNSTIEISAVVERYRVFFALLYKHLEDIGDLQWHRDKNRITPLNHDHIAKLFKEQIHSCINRIREEKNWGYSMMIQKICRELEEKYPDPEISLSSTALSHDISSAYLSQIFKSVTGETFMEYLTNIRINQAKKLLMSSSMKLYEIAEHVGYFDYPHFSKVFKKNLGISPSKYRQRERV